MCWYRQYQYACGHPGPTRFSRPCERYPTCNTRRMEGGIFNLRENCPECLYDGAEKKSSKKRSGKK
ncbi:hypothetical protein C8A03DRAFT_18860 [Achaetomium macrosporum]|uniref:Uncharacterized protein n=1 Tax=Achaetomium macrosporum TaxID=79813 RepID=A0AAN7C2T8_9PEZI|nr:hypothetical protein C8A03DRAFT_18860 [Achaetomium macrosporum]